MPEPAAVFAPIDHDLRVCGLVPGAVYAQLGTLELDPELVADPEPGPAVKSLAFHTQAAVLENLQAIKGGRPWPVCQGKHPHPMSLASDAEGGWPYWYCPKNPSYRFAVGQHPGG
ncbi:hypothetical protein AB0C96_41185 [Streptomyces sp. NPDC048506]|uniref:hypothetical protein n=1 Tax=Streptomyces sp. NPDC048506 TaxID=3155028 RepID=UPI003439B24A